MTDDPAPQRLTKEADLSRAIQIALCARGHRVWRNNVGLLFDARGKAVRYGLATGSADLIGITRQEGRFLSIEVKLPGRKPTRQQQRWRAMVIEMGGVAGVAHSVEEAVEIAEDNAAPRKLEVNWR
jgi:VRR-NUC domain